MRTLKKLVFCVVRVAYKVFRPLILFWHKVATLLRIALWRAKLKYCGECVSLYKGIVIHNPNNVSIGDNVSIAEYVHIWGGGCVSIGNDSIIAAHAIITSQTHDPRSRRYRDSCIYLPVTIGANVWIGSAAIILPGVEIGANVIIGAGSVVNRNVKAGLMVAGVPAKPLE